MHTVLFCFANDRTRPLASLSDEDAGIDRLLDARSSQNHFQKVRDSFATTASITGKLQDYKDSLCLFHFSGHAGSNVLQFEDTPARGVGMAQLLARCPELQLVFLNGCSTLNHIKLLADQHVKAAVIATTAPINDTIACQFSLAFYQALAGQYSLQQALDKARLSIQVTVPTTIQAISRGAFDTSEDVGPDKWYVYYPDDDATQWTLPTGTTTDAVLYVPNSILRKTLFATLRTTDDTLTQLFKTRQSLPDDGLRDWLHEEELRRLPFPMAEPIRKLLCPQLSPDGKLVQPTPTRDRLSYYSTLFQSSVDLLMSILFAQLRDWLQHSGQPANQLSEAPKKLMQEAITTGWHGWTADQFVAAIQTIRAFMDQQQIPYFIPAIKPWLDRFGTDARMMYTLHFLFTLDDRLADPTGIGNIPALCQLGEEHLSNWLSDVGFWAVYRLESLRNIRAVRFYQQPPAYRHEMVALRTSQSYRADETYFQEVLLPDLWDCQSVLLVKIQRRLTDAMTPEEELVPGAFLNLAPFVIDRNVFLKSDNAVFDLYSFLTSESGRLRYKHISRPDDLPLTIDATDGDLLGKQDFSVLREQMNALRHLLDLSDDSTASTSTSTPIATDIDPDALSRI